MDDESKQMIASSLDVKVSNNQFLKNSLPVIEHAGSSGEGFPYAPENWPSQGDVWTWRVGKRYTLAGFWQDRSIHPPESLRSSIGNKMAFNSRVSLEQYIRNAFPDADVDAFFASFIWKIPCTNAAKEIANAYASPGCSKAAPAGQPGNCKAGNEMCSIKAKTSSSLTHATCYVCCTEPNFCRYCCCILCSKTIEWICEGYNFIECEAPVDEKFICGHVAHIECALRAYMTGKVGGSIDLDAQYYCRCCDNKTDLLLHVDTIIKVCESMVNRDDKEKVLNLGLCILRGSEKDEAKKLCNHIAMLMEELKYGASLDEICKKKSEISNPVRGQEEMGRERSLLARLFAEWKSGQEKGGERDPYPKRARHSERDRDSPSRLGDRSHKSHRRESDRGKGSRQSFVDQLGRKHSPSHSYERFPVEHTSFLEEIHTQTTAQRKGSTTAAISSTSLSKMTPLHSSTIPITISTSTGTLPSVGTIMLPVGHAPTRQLQPLGPPDSVPYTKLAEWIDTASYNLSVLIQKYDFAKVRINNDQITIDRLTKDKEVLFKAALNHDKERTQDKNIIDRLASEKTALEKRVKELEGNKARLELEVTSAASKIHGLETDLTLARVDMQSFKIQSETLQQRNEELKGHNTNLLEHVNILQADLEGLKEDNACQEEMIGESENIIDDMCYNFWRYKDFSWTKEQGSILLMIKQRAVKEEQARLQDLGEEFDEDIFLFAKFSDHERELITMEEYMAESSGPDKGDDRGDPTKDDKHDQTFGVAKEDISRTSSPTRKSESSPAPALDPDAPQAHYAGTQSALIDLSMDNPDPMDIHGLSAPALTTEEMIDAMKNFEEPTLDDLSLSSGPQQLTVEEGIKIKREQMD